MKNVVYLNAYKEAETYTKQAFEGLNPEKYGELTPVMKAMMHSAFLDGFKAGVEQVKNQVINIIPGKEQ